MLSRVFVTAIFLLSFCVMAQPGGEFAGTWKLNAKASEIHSLPAPPDAVLKVEIKDKVMVVSGASIAHYPLDNQETRRKAGDSTYSTRTKWEGSALLVNTLVTGPQSYTVMERWKPSRDGSTLSVKRTIVRMSGESESLLVYENPAVVASKKEDEPVTIVPAKPRVSAPEEYVVDAGTRILLSLVSSVNTKQAAPGDRIQLQTNYPVLSLGRIVIPKGSYVMGTVTDAQRAGRVKGKASLYLRFDSITLPNGVTRDFRARVGSADADVDRKEGRINGQGTKGKDAKTVGTTTAAGAGIGSMAGGAMGAGIGAAAGAVGGLIGVMGSRGQDLMLPRGSTMEMVLDRELRFTGDELR